MVAGPPAGVQETEFSTVKARSSFCASHSGCQPCSALPTQHLFFLSFPPGEASLQPPGVAELQSGSRSSRASFPIPPESPKRRGRAGCCTLELLSMARLGWWELWSGDGVSSFAKSRQDNKHTLMTAEEHNLTSSICKLWCLLPPLSGQVSRV